MPKTVPQGLANAFRNLTGQDLQKSLAVLPRRPVETSGTLVDTMTDLGCTRSPPNFRAPQSKPKVAEHAFRQYISLIEYYNVSEKFDVWCTPQASEQARDRFMYDVGEAYTRLETINIGQLATYRIHLEDIDDGTAGLYYSDRDLIEVGLMTATSHGGTYLKTTLHEIGHRFHYRAGRARMDPYIEVLYDYAAEHDDSLFCTWYSREKITEYWAEWFCHYFLDRITNQYMIDWIEQMIENFTWF